MNDPSCRPYDSGGSPAGDSSDVADPVGPEDHGALGFSWPSDGADPAPSSVERVVARYHRALPEFVWDAAVLENNPFTYPEVQTLLDGVTVGGHTVSDEHQVLRLADSTRELRRLVLAGDFALAKPVSERPSPPPGCHR